MLLCLSACLGHRKPRHLCVLLRCCIPEISISVLNLGNAEGLPKKMDTWLSTTAQAIFLSVPFLWKTLILLP